VQLWQMWKSMYKSVHLFIRSTIHDTQTRCLPSIPPPEGWLQMFIMYYTYRRKSANRTYMLQSSTNHRQSMTKEIGNWDWAWELVMLSAAAAAHCLHPSSWLSPIQPTTLQEKLGPTPSHCSPMPPPLLPPPQRCWVRTRGAPGRLV